MQVRLDDNVGGGFMIKFYVVVHCLSLADIDKIVPF